VVQPAYPGAQRRLDEHGPAWRIQDLASRVGDPDRTDGLAEPFGDAVRTGQEPSLRAAVTAGTYAATNHSASGAAPNCVAYDRSRSVDGGAVHLAYENSSAHDAGATTPEAQNAHQVTPRRCRPSCVGGQFDHVLSGPASQQNATSSSAAARSEPIVAGRAGGGPLSLGVVYAQWDRSGQGGGVFISSMQLRRRTADVLTPCQEATAPTRLRASQGWREPRSGGPPGPARSGHLVVSEARSLHLSFRLGISREVQAGGSARPAPWAACPLPARPGGWAPRCLRGMRLARAPWPAPVGLPGGTATGRFARPRDQHRP